MKHLNLILISLFFLMFNNSFSQEFPTRGEIFDYEVGDLFHTQFFASAFGGSGMAEYKNIEIISKFYSNNDSVVSYGRFIRGEVSSSDYPDWQYYEEFDTISIGYLYDTLYADTVYEDENQYNGRKTTYYHDYYEENMYYYTLFNVEHTIGCGKVYREYDEVHSDGYSYSEFKLVYFKKGDEEWGEEQIVGFAETKHTKELKVYPNPANTHIQFDIPQSKKTHKLFITNITGHSQAELIVQPYQNKVQWDCSRVSSGVYFYHCEMGEHVYRGKIVVN
jgi:hypothetical protein